MPAAFNAGTDPALSWLPRSLSGSIVCAAAAALGLRVVWRALKDRPSGQRAASATDFNSFLTTDVSLTRACTEIAQEAKDKNNFDSFLKQPAQRLSHPNEFKSFLKQQEGNEAEEVDASKSQADEQDAPEDDQAIITVLYGTEYGFAKEISEKLCELLRENKKFWPQLLDMADGPLQCNLSSQQVILIVCSTQGDGVAPSEAREFCDWLQGTDAPALPSTSYSVCALGDNSYTNFCACGRALDARFAELGAGQLAARQDVNREDWNAVNCWLHNVVQAVALLPLKTVAKNGSYSLSSKRQSQRIGKQNPYLAKIIAVEGLCKIVSPSDKDTVRVEFDLIDSSLEYEPGDALGIHASNAPQVVSDLIHFIKGDARSLHNVPAWHYNDERFSGQPSMSLFDILTYCYNLKQPKQEIFECLQKAMPYANGREKKERGSYPASCIKENDMIEEWHGNGIMNGHLKESSPGQKQDLNRPSEIGSFDIAPSSWSRTSSMSPSQQAKKLKQLITCPSEDLERYLQPRHVIDILVDFDSADLALEQLLNCLHALQPRLYSISSSPLENANTVQVTVAVVRYKSLQQNRLGVASTLLAERIKVGDCLPLYISKNPDFRLPKDPTRPIVMVGPGTGLAPFRSFILHRILGGQPSGLSILFFGCRQRDQDYLYGQDLERWAEAGHIQLYTAFSREQKEKMYVQNRLLEAGEQVWGALQAGGHFYVCGDASSMAGAVEHALLQIICQFQGEGQQDGEVFLRHLQREGRYQRDVWY